MLQLRMRNGSSYKMAEAVQVHEVYITFVRRASTIFFEQVSHRARLKSDAGAWLCSQSGILPSQYTPRAVDKVEWPVRLQLIHD